MSDKGQREEQDAIEESAEDFDLNSGQAESFFDEDFSGEGASVEQEWAEIAKLRPRPSPLGLMLMAAVVVSTSWLIYGFRSDIAYFFASDQPIDLGDSLDYIIVVDEEGLTHRSKEHEFPHNAFVKIKGLPVHRAAADPEKSTFSFRVMEQDQKIIYQLEGTKIFVEEALSDNHLNLGEGEATDSAERSVVEMVELEGRLISFAEDEAGIYAGLRAYYTSKYGMKFCSDLPPAEVERAQAELGRGGLVLQSSDGGQSFVEGSSGTSAELEALAFGKEKTWAVGANGTFLESEDSGLTWSQRALGTSARLYDLDFAPDGSWGILGGHGGVLWRTQDGGASFEQAYDYVDQTIRGVKVFDKDRAVVVGAEGLVLETKDRGRTWSPRPVVALPDFNDILRTSSGALIAVGEGGLLLRSEDQGSSWRRVVTDTQEDLNAIAMSPDGSRLVVAGEGPSALYSVDDGKSWAASRVRVVPGLAFNHSFLDLAFDATGQRVIFVGRKGAIGLSLDGGLQVQLRTHSHATGVVVSSILADRTLPQALFDARSHTQNETFYAAAWRGDEIWAIGRDGQAIRSQNAATHWENVSLELDEPLHLRDIVFTTAEQGFIIGDDGLMLQTTNGGDDWVKIDAATKRDIHHLTPFYDPQGEFDGLLYAGDRGLWGYWWRPDNKCYLRAPKKKLDYRSIAPLEYSGKIKELKVVMAGEEAALMSQDDSTAEVSLLWQVQPSTLSAIAVAAERTPTGPNHSTAEHVGLAIGADGALMRSTNGGLTFSQEPSGTTQWLRALDLSPTGELAVVGGDEGVLLIDVDVQHRWQRRSTPTKEAISSLHLLGSSLLMAQGDGLWRIETQALIAGESALAPAMKTEPSPSENTDPPPDDAPAEEAIAAEGAEGQPEPNNLTSSPVGASEASSPSSEAQPQLPFIRVAKAQGRIFTLALDSNSGFGIALGEPGVQLFSSDAGQSWVSVQQGPPETITSVALRGELAVAAGASGSIYVLKDKEKSWKKVETGLTGPLSGVIALPNGRWLVFGPDGALLQSTDEAVTWVQLSPATNGDLLGAFVGAEEKAWLVGSDQTFFYSTDGGSSWSPRGTLVSGLYDLDFAADGLLGAAVGDDGTVIKTEDGGVTWMRRESFQDVSLYAVSMHSEGEFGVAVGARGTIVRTLSGGDVWLEVKVDLPENLQAVSLIEDENGETGVVIGGQDGVLYFSENKKMKRFTLAASPIQEDIRALGQTSTGELIAVGGSPQDPSSICEAGYVLKPGVTPRSHWKYLLMAILLGGFGLFTLVKLLRNLLQLASDASGS